MASPEAASRCAGCGKDSDVLFRCGRCESVRYCSQRCQAIDWRFHQHVCSPVDHAKEPPSNSSEPSQLKDVQNKEYDQSNTSIQSENSIDSVESMGEIPEDASTELDASERCSYCGRSGSDEASLWRCSACEVSRYCSIDCQRLDWSHHKKICIGVKSSPQEYMDSTPKPSWIGEALSWQNHVDATFEISSPEFFAQFMSDQSDFLQYFHNTRGDTDLVVNKWKRDNDLGGWRKEISFCAPVNIPMAGPSCTVLEDMHLYLSWNSLDFQSSNDQANAHAEMRSITKIQGLPYCDCFSIEARWMLLPLSSAACRLRVGMTVVFHSWTIMSSVIETAATDIAAKSAKVFVGLAHQYIRERLDNVSKEDYREELKKPVPSMVPPVSVSKPTVLRRKRGLFPFSWQLVTISVLSAVCIYLWISVRDLQDRLQRLEQRFDHK